MAKVPRMRYDLNLSEIFGSKIQDRALREAIAQSAIEKIIERTRSGTSLKGGGFKGYSKAYQNSTAFKAFGKSAQVDLTLAGDMLDQLTVIEQNTNRITLGWEDSLQNAKAYNHNTGDTLPKREFFGLQKKEIDELKQEFASAVERFSELDEARGTDAFTSAAVRAIVALTEEEA